MIIKRLPLISLLSLVLALSVGSKTLATPNTAMMGPIDVWNRSEVVAKYNQYINQPLARANWTGSFNTCDRGSVSDALIEQGFGVLNWYRAMMGLSSAVYDSGQSYQSQGRALTMAANRYIGHTLTPNMKCYSSNGSVPSKGQYEVMAAYDLPYSIQAYAYEYVINQWGLAHRDFVFYKGQPKVGMGFTGYSVASISGNTGVNTFPTNNTGSFSIGSANVLAFPGRGYYPYQAISSDWSIKLEAPGAGAIYDMSQASATVTATRNGITSNCNIATSYISSQLVLRMDQGDCKMFFSANCADTGCNIPFNNSLYLSGDTRYDITVRGARTNTGVAIPEFSYFTILIDPNPPVLPNINISLSNNTVAENSPAGTLIGKLTGSQDPYKYYILDSNVAGAIDNDKVKIEKVDIDPSYNVNYEYRLVVKNSIDYEKTSQLKVGVRLYNYSGFGKSQLITVNVINVNEPATAIRITGDTTYTSTVAANTTLGSFIVTDPENTQTHSKILVSGQGNNNLFTISGNQLKNIAPLPKGLYTIVIRVTDNGIPAKTTDLTMYYRVGLSPVYRFYNFKTGAHFYTTNEVEKNKVINTLADTFVYENIAYYVDILHDGNCSAGLAPVYRFYNFMAGSHFYTTNIAERDKVINTLAYTFAYEGPRYCLSLTGTSTFNKPIYRFYHYGKGFHFYTANEAERDKVINTLQYLYIYEGPRFYGASAS